MTRPSRVMALSAALAAALIALALTTTWSPISLTRDDGGSAGADSSPYLFVLTGEQATLTGDAAGPLALTVTGIAPQGTYFSDRPVRDAGTLTTDDVIADVWDPEIPAPNVALTGELADGTEVTLALELTDPSYDVATDTFTATATPIGETTPGLAHFEFTASGDLPPTLGRPSLFIDTNYDRCQGSLENNTSVTLTRTDYGPTAHRRWSSGGPPASSVDAGATETWVYRWHNITEEKDGHVVYSIEGSDQTVEFTWSCRFQGTDQVTDADCEMNGTGPYTCTGGRKKFLSSDLSWTAYFTVDGG